MKLRCAVLALLYYYTDYTVLPLRNRGTFHDSAERLAAAINLQHHAGSPLAQVAEHHNWLACTVWAAQALNVTGSNYPALRASFLRLVLLSPRNNMPSERVCTGETVGRAT